MAAVDADRPGAKGRHLTEPGWYPDPWQPGGWRWHDGRTWTAWTGPPPGPPIGGWTGRATGADLDAERRTRLWAELAVVGFAVLLAISATLVTAALREMFSELIALVRRGDPTTEEIDRAIDAASDRQDDYWWLNVIGLVPVLLLAAMAVWTNRVAATALRLGYRARHSAGWAAAGWFVPIVNLWFPYESIVDSVSPTNPRRRIVLTWWLVYVLGGLSSIPVIVLGMFTDTSLVLLALVPVAVGIAQALLGVRVIALVHDDHAAAISGS